MRIVIIGPSRRGQWQTNLTDGASRSRRRRHTAAIPALEEVVRCLSAGHVPAFASAFNSLVTTAVADDDAPPCWAAD